MGILKLDCVSNGIVNGVTLFTAPSKKTTQGNEWEGLMISVPWFIIMQKNNNKALYCSTLRVFPVFTKKSMSKHSTKEHLKGHHNFLQLCLFPMYHYDMHKTSQHP